MQTEILGVDELRRYQYSVGSHKHVVKLGKPESSRWFILILYCAISALQCNAWFTFSALPDEVQQYYHLKNPGEGKVNHTIDMWINYGPIMYILTTPFAAYLLLYPINGLRYTILLAASFIFFGSFIRCIPSVLHDIDPINYKITNSFWDTLIFIHFGQILVNIAGPLVMSVPSKLSVIWFPDYQRKTATAIAAISNSFGQCLAYTAPLIVRHNSANFKYVMYIDLLLIFVICLLAWIYFPASPQKLPTIAAKAALLSVPVDELYKFGNEMKSTRSGSLSVWDATESIGSIGSGTNVTIGNNEQMLRNPLFCGSDVSHIWSNIQHSDNHFTLKRHLRNLLSEVKWMMASLSTVLMIFIGGIEIGTFVAWCSILPDIIGPSSSLHLSDDDVGIIAVVAICGYMFGGVIIGPISDKWFAKRLKRLLSRICMALIVCVLCLSFVVPSPLENVSIFKVRHSMKQKMMMICILNGICGLFVGCSLPIIYELCAEISYPASEGTSAILFVFMQNVSMLFFVAIAAWISTQWFTVFLLAVCVLCVVLLFFVKEKYKRL